MYVYIYINRKGEYETWLLITLVGILLVISREPKIIKATALPETVTGNKYVQILKIPFKSAFSLLLKHSVMKSWKSFYKKASSSTNLGSSLPLINFKKCKISEFVLYKFSVHSCSAFQAKRLCRKIYRNTVSEK